MSSFHLEGAFNNANGAFFFLQQSQPYRSMPRPRRVAEAALAIGYSLSLRQRGVPRQTL
jgi:hypothetical protein